MQKKCRECKIIKPLSEFHNRTVARDGKDSQCKLCRSRRIKDKGTTLKEVKSNSVNYSRIGRHTEEILTNLGYELYNDDNPIYKQFYKRMQEKGVDITGW